MVKLINMNTENYKKASLISRIIDRTEEVERFASDVLLDEQEQSILTQIKRNTNSIKKIIEKYLDNLQANG
jgi:hypothetical protein